MSRTKKGTKPPGYEYWARRYMSMALPGSDTKTITRRAERRIAKQKLKKDDEK